MSETDLLYHPIGEPVDGFQLHGLETQGYNSYLVLRKEVDPNKEVDPTEGTPAPVEFTLYRQEPGSDHLLTVQAEWDTKIGVLPFANIAEAYYQGAEGGLPLSDVDDFVDLSVFRYEDEYPEATIEAEYPRPLDSFALGREIEGAGIDLEEVSSVVINSAPGALMWSVDDRPNIPHRLSVAIAPEVFSNVLVAAGAIVGIFELSRDRETTPTGLIFEQGLMQALVDSEARLVKSPPLTP